MIASELAKAAGVNASVVRYYSRIGLLHPSRNPENGYRCYNAADIDRVRFIRKARWLGFTLKDVETILDLSDSGQSPCREVRHIIRERVVENQQRLVRLREMQKRMEAAIETWKSVSNGPPNPENICELIEGLDCEEE